VSPFKTQRNFLNWLPKLRSRSRNFFDVPKNCRIIALCLSEISLKTPEFTLKLLSELSLESSREQRTKFVHFACITFAQYCTWVLSNEYNKKGEKNTQSYISFWPKKGVSPTCTQCTILNNDPLFGRVGKGVGCYLHKVHAIQLTLFPWRRIPLNPIDWWAPRVIPTARSCAPTISTSRAY